MLYTFRYTIHTIGQRIARKLQEQKFISGSFNHVYINFTTILPNDKLVLSNRNSDNAITSLVSGNGGLYFFDLCGRK
jgi:hypothetical protein